MHKYVKSCQLVLLCLLSPLSAMSLPRSTSSLAQRCLRRSTTPSLPQSILKAQWHNHPITYYTDDGETTPLHIAICEGDLWQVKKIIKTHRSYINQPDEYGRTPLFLACAQGAFPIVAELLTIRGIDVNQANSNDATPLYIAALGGHSDIVDLLLSQEQIAVNRTRRGGYTPLYIACQEGHTNVVALLLQDPRVLLQIRADSYFIPKTPYQIAYTKGHKDVVSLFHKIKCIPGDHY